VAEEDKAEVFLKGNSRRRGFGVFNKRDIQICFALKFLFLSDGFLGLNLLSSRA